MGPGPARWTAVEAAVAGLPSIDGAAGDIQPVAAAAAAGTSGKLADAKHVHAGVTSFNTRKGIVTLSLADVVSTFTAVGQLFAGTGNGTGELLGSGASGSVLTVGGADPTGLQWSPGPWSAGDLKFTSAINFSTSWLLANGQAVSRTTYASLYSASIWTLAATVVNNNKVITIPGGVPPLLQGGQGVGYPVECAGYFPSGTTITAASSTTITVSNNATAGGSPTIVVFPYGNGDGASTFNVINMTGRFPLGASGAGNNTSPQYGLGSYITGEQLHALVTGELAQHTHSGTTSTEVGTHIHNFSGKQYVFLASTSTLYLSTTPTAQPVSFDTPETDTSSEEQPHTHTFTTATTGSGTGHNNMPPFSVGQWLVHI